MKATSEVSAALVISVLSLSPAERCHCSIYRRRYQCISTLSRDNEEDGRGKVLMKSNFVFFQASADNKQVQCLTSTYKIQRITSTPLILSLRRCSQFVLVCGIM